MDKFILEIGDEDERGVICDCGTPDHMMEMILDNLEKNLENDCPVWAVYTCGFYGVMGSLLLNALLLDTDDSDIYKESVKDLVFKFQDALLIPENRKRFFKLVEAIAAQSKAAYDEEGVENNLEGALNQLGEYFNSIEQRG